MAIELELGRDDYGLVVVGAGNHAWYDRLVLGTVSTHLLHESEVPVMAIHRLRDGDGPVRALVGADGSPSADRAIETLIAIARPTALAVEVRSVVEAVLATAAAQPGAFVDPALLDEFDAERSRAAQGHVDRAVERFRAAGFRVEGSVGMGNAATDLLQRAADTEADLVVVGARGLGPLARLTVGSVSAHLARHAPAVLVAHAPRDVDRR